MTAALKQSRIERQMRRDRTVAGLCALADYVMDEGRDAEAEALRAAATLAQAFLMDGRHCLRLSGGWMRVDRTAKQAAVRLFDADGRLRSLSIYTGGEDEAKAVRKARDLVRRLPDFVLMLAGGSIS